MIDPKALRKRLEELNVEADCRCGNVDATGLLQTVYEAIDAAEPVETAYVVTSGDTDTEARIMQGVALTLEAAERHASLVRAHIDHVYRLSGPWVGGGKFVNDKKTWFHSRSYVRIEEARVEQ